MDKFCFAMIGDVINKQGAVEKHNQPNKISKEPPQISVEYNETVSNQKYISPDTHPEDPSD